MDWALFRQRLDFSNYPKLLKLTQTIPPPPRESSAIVLLPPHRLRVNQSWPLNVAHFSWRLACPFLLWSTVATAFKITLTYLSPLPNGLCGSKCKFLLCFLAHRDFWCNSASTKIIPELRKHFRYYLILGLLNPLVLLPRFVFKPIPCLPASQAQPLNYTWAMALTLHGGIISRAKKSESGTGSPVLLGYLGVLVDRPLAGDILGLNFTSGCGRWLGVTIDFPVGGLLDFKYPP